MMRRLAALTVLLVVAPARAHAAPDAGTPAAVPAPPRSQWEDEIQALERADKERAKQRRTTSPVVFMGSSSIRLWESLAQDFPYHHVVNRGFGGSQIADSVELAARILAPYKPPIIVLYAGSNDINAGKSPETVAADFKAFTAKLAALRPETHVAFVSIGPSPQRWAQVAKVREANKLIAAHCASNPKLHFVDIFPEMLGDDGKPRAELFQTDQLHMTRAGYQRWIPHIRKTIDAIDPPARVRLTK